MYPRRLLKLLAIGAILALLAACGGNGDTEAGDTADTTTTAPATTSEVTGDPADVPPDAVAVVGDTPVLRVDFDRFFTQAQKAYEAQGREFPAAGTQEYEQIKTQALEFLVQRIEFEKEAAELGISVSEDEIQTRLAELKQQFFQGDEQAYQDELENQGLTEADVLADLRAQIISQALFDEVTKNETVSDADIKAYYDNNVAQFSTPESRQVAHILVETKAEADDIYEELQGGADFAELATKFSTDPGSKDQGGELEDVRGSFVPEFEEVAFALETGEIGEPVESQFGWHVIKALEDTVPAVVQTLEEVTETVREQLLVDKRNTAMTAWVASIQEKYASQIAYAVGFAPATTQDLGVTDIPETGGIDTGATESP